MENTSHEYFNLDSFRPPAHNFKEAEPSPELPHDILSIDKNATLDQINFAYGKKITELYPEGFEDDSEKHKISEKLKQAFQTMVEKITNHSELKEEKNDFNSLKVPIRKPLPPIEIPKAFKPDGSFTNEFIESKFEQSKEKILASQSVEEVMEIITDYNKIFAKQPKRNGQIKVVSLFSMKLNGKKYEILKTQGNVFEAIFLQKLD